MCTGVSSSSDVSYPLFDTVRCRMNSPIRVMARIEDPWVPLPIPDWPTPGTSRSVEADGWVKDGDPEEVRQHFAIPRNELQIVELHQRRDKALSAPVLLARLISSSLGLPGSPQPSVPTNLGIRS